MTFQFLCSKQANLLAQVPGDAIKASLEWLESGNDLYLQEKHKEALDYFGAAFESSWIGSDSNTAEAGTAIVYLAQSACALARCFERMTRLNESQSVLSATTMRITRELNTVNRRSAIRGLAKICAYKPLFHFTH